METNVTTLPAEEISAREQGKRLAVVRKELAMTQSELAVAFNKMGRTGCSQAYISSLESGKQSLTDTYRRDYIMLGANPDYLRHGTGSTLKRTKTAPSSDVVIAAIKEQSRGNARYVGLEDQAAFLETKGEHAPAFKFTPAQVDDMFWFDVHGNDMGIDYPSGSMVVAYPVPKNALTKGLPYVFATNDEVIFRRYAGKADAHYKLSAPHGEEILLKTDDVWQVYLVKQRLVSAV